MRHEILYTDELGTPIDITNCEFSILECVPSVIENVVFTMIDPVAGKIEMFLDDYFAAQLRPGSTNWFRLSVKMPDGCRNNTEKIGITVE